MATKSKPQIPAELLAKLNAADEARGFPIGTMASVMRQETGGQSKYYEKPDSYHYGLNADGRRIAGHTGKVSTAFGPFGILESTGKDPGYGVKPLASKDLDEQIRFAADYLGARTKKAGSLQAGLSGYGEGPDSKYAQQVLGRIGNVGAGRGRISPLALPDEAVLAAAPQSQEPVVGQPLPPVDAPVQVAQAEPAATAQPHTPDQMNAWQKYQADLVAAVEQGKVPAQVPPQQYAAMQNYGLNIPDFQATVAQGPQAIDFRSFGKWGGRATA